MSIPLLAAGLTAESFDSAALAGTAVVSHPISEAGEWLATLSAGRVPLAQRTLVALADGGAAMVPLEPGGTDEPRLRAGGHVRLRAPNGRGLAATLQRAGDDAPAWSSRVLQDGDWFACLPLRPGRYRLDNRITQAAMEVIVRYPDPREPRDPPGRTAPVYVQAGEGFQQSVVEFFPGQPLIVAVSAPAHLVLALEAADDGPADLAAWRAQADAEALAAIGARGRSGVSGK